MGDISLEASIRTCRPNIGNAERMQSDRFLNPMQKLCFNFSGRDSVGRPVCEDSYYTMSGGCQSAVTRINVENALRPQYLEYLGLDARGLLGDNLNYNDNLLDSEVQNAWIHNQNLRNITGDFGQNLGGYLRPSCSLYPDQYQEDFVNLPRQRQQQRGQQQCNRR